MLAFYQHDLSPFAVHVFGNWGVRWYGLAYAVGFLVGLWLFRRWAKQGWLPLSPLACGDYVMTLVAGILVGGRLGYCLLYDIHGTLEDPLRIFRIWEGGMASHGGVVGMIVSAILFARSHKVSAWRLLDAVALGAAPGIVLGRLANFINGELWGRPSSLPWAVIFPTSPLPLVPRHPSQIYEALLEGLLYGLILWGVKKRFIRCGAVCAAGLIAYPLLRFIGEMFREPDTQIGYLSLGLTQGQWLSLLTLLGGLCAAAWLTRRAP